jgi:pimeloyl-ACP methyl ester carboxylesterase
MPSPDDFDVAVSSGCLRLRRWGQARSSPVLGIPGLTGNLESFTFLGERLAGDDLQLVAMDLRGRGHSSTTPPGTYGWERHARDVLAVADALGFGRFAMVGQSMGASVAMKVAELDPSRVSAVVLVDVAGRVDPGVGPVIAESVLRLGRVFESVEDYLNEVRSSGLAEPWSEYWQRVHRYELRRVEGGVMSRTSAEAVAEDRAYTLTRDPYDRWAHLTMPTLLARAAREMRPGAGFVVPVDDLDRFTQTVPWAEVIQVDANHLTINTHPSLAATARAFLGRHLGL